MNLPHHASGERDYIAMRTLTVVRQYLAAAFLLVIGLVAYGCGDSATVNPVVELASLTVDPGTLQPAFSGGTTQYTVDLSNSIRTVTITAQPAVAGDTVTINGQATTSSVISLGAAGTTTSVNIVVSETGTNSRTYTVLLVRAGLTGNNSLQNLTVSPGTLAPAFDQDLQAYTVTVANNIGNVTVTPTLSDPVATMTVNGQPAISGQDRTIPLNGPGQSTPITIVVIAQSGAPKSYLVTVSRGISNNNNLQGLTISPGTLSPAFRAGIVAYTVNVASTVDRVTITPRVQDSTATMTVTPLPITISGQARTIQLNGAGSNTLINIQVTAENGSQKTYTVNVIRAAPGANNNLSALSVTPGPLVPTFSQTNLTYTVDVASTVTSVNVAATKADPNAVMSGSVTAGAGTASGQATILLGGPGTTRVVSITVTAPSGSSKTYSITVERAAQASNNNLSALSVTPGPLVPTFSPTTLTYTVDVASAVTSVNVAATKADPNAVMSGSVTAGAGTASGQTTIQLGGPGTTRVVLITVTALSGSSKTYSITVERAAQASNNNLSALSVTPGPLVPTFSPTTLTYTVDVASTVTGVNVAATKADPNAVMSGSLTAGAGTASGQTTIQLGGPGTTRVVLITMTAPSGSSKTYSITVERAAQASNNNLSALSVSPGALVPVFDANTTSYTVNVANDVTSVNVSATKADPNAVMSGSVTAGTGVATGQATIPLNGAGTSTPVSIAVTAPNGSSKTYTITVNRSATTEPPPPAIAPDLIREDDSCATGVPPDECAPGTSREDNITNVTRPRFSIPQPGAGETATLYINGNKDAASSTTGNILTPSTSLSDGTYDITYTLSNSGGESDESPIMMTPPPQLQRLRIDTTGP